MIRILLFQAIIFSFLNYAQAARSTSSGTAGSGSELSELSLGIERSLYVDMFLFTGYTQFSHANFSDTVNGTQSGIGLTVGAKLGAGFFIGITTDYRYMGQMSTVDGTHTNFTSTRLVPFSPTFGFKSDSFLLKLDYQFLGDLELSKPLSDNSTEKLGKPSGFRLIFIFDKWFKLAPVGIYAESVKYSQLTNSATGITDLSHTLDTWQVGGIINVLF